MKRLLLTASALALAATVSPAVTSSAQAAPAKSPFCNMAKGQKNLVSWNSYYHCLSPAPQAERTSLRARPTYGEARSYNRPAYAETARETRSPFCNMAKGQKNLVSWNSYYHCLSPAPQAERTSLQARPTYGEAEARSYNRPAYAEAGRETRSPFCNMAKGQKNLVSWNSYYHCLSPAPQAEQASLPARPNYYRGYARAPARTYDYVAAAAPSPVAGGDVAWCQANFRSYNPATGMYLGYDGLHHPCP